ncbi:hypothetical protein TSUD_122270 [Trifolium subterraneum]|nr:hypothetical protein TSUD_122270 [Trifolium subterraneum]
MPITVETSIVSQVLLSRTCLTFLDNRRLFLLTTAVTVSPKKSCISCAFVKSKLNLNVGGSVEKDKKGKKKVGKTEHHLWQRRDSAQSAKRHSLLSELLTHHHPIPMAMPFGLNHNYQRSRHLRIDRLSIYIRLAKWMLSKGQGATMGTYDTLLLAFGMEQRVDEAESLWNMIIHAHTRSVSKRLFSRMISLYDHHDLPDKIVEVFADMEELRVKPDEDTVKKVTSAFKKLGQEEKRKLVIKRYGLKWKYIHFNGERVRVRTQTWEEDQL